MTIEQGFHAAFALKFKDYSRAKINFTRAKSRLDCLTNCHVASNFLKLLLGEDYFSSFEIQRFPGHLERYAVFQDFFERGN